MGDIGRVPVGIVGASGYGSASKVSRDHHPGRTRLFRGESSGKSFRISTPSSSFSSNRASRSRKIASRCRFSLLNCLSNGTEVVGEGMQGTGSFSRLPVHRSGNYTAWYGTEVTKPATAVYGLPELYRDRIAEPA